MLDLGVELGIVEKGGSWFSYEGSRLGQGRENAKKFLEDNPELLEEIEKKVKEKRDQISGMISDELDDDGNDDPDDEDDGFEE